MNDQRKTKKALIQELNSLEYAESIINTVREPLIVLDQDLRVVTASRSFYDVFKVKFEETEGQLIYDLGNRQWNIPKLRKLLEDILPQKTTFDNYEVEHDFLTIGKRIMLLNARQIHRVLGKEKIILLAIEDITERRLIEEKLLLAAIVQSSKDGIIGKSLDGIITSWNKGAEEIYGYTKSEIIGKSVSVLLPPELPDEMNEILRKIKFEESIKNYETVRIRKDGQHIYVSLTISAIHDDEGRILGASTIARDITERKQAEEQLHQTLDRLTKAVETTILVLGIASEARDPYTAGHQKRVADLACTIAAEMGLAQDKIEGIRMASSIHDIGKLSIPAEILVKPTKLTDIEFSLIKYHSKSGYEMLKEVESPWPLAQIVYQHHERMDGSGYPRNLKGDEILMEARILAVADVVEAMASHRPYRPALGIEVALEEIEKNKGILYDNAVADACLRLFRKKGYQLT